MSLVIDHLLYAGPNLEQLVGTVGSQAGVPTEPGGRHRGQGTHNALVGLGVGRYLELMALDPAGDEGGSGAFGRSIAYLHEPAMHTWCARVDDAADLTGRAKAAGLRLTKVEGGRTRTDGVQLSWTLIGVSGHRFGGLVPFFIDWRGSPHPSADLGGGLHLAGLQLAHPEPSGLTQLLEALGGPIPDVEVEHAVRPGMSASFTGPLGPFVLAGAGGVMDFG